MIDTKLLTFIKLCETKSFTKTAEVLYITQPSVTNHIKTLEKMYSIKLFIPNDKNFTLTPQGKVLYDYAMKLIAFEEGFLRMMEASKVGNRRVAFAVTPGVMQGYLKNILPEWTKRNPDLSYCLEELPYYKIEDAMTQGVFDFAIVDQNLIKRNLAAKVLYKSNLVLAVGQAHHLAEKKKLHFEELKNERFFIETKQSGKRAFFESELHSKNCDLRDIKFLNEINDFNMILEIVINGNGISIFYESEIEAEIKNGKLIPIELIESKNQVEFRVIYSKNHLALESIEKTIEDFSKIAKEINYLNYSSSFK